jgi:hypothetical protein
VTAWIDPTRPWTNPLPIPDLPERLLVDFATRCNLRCPMSPVWGPDDERHKPPPQELVGAAPGVL